MPRLHDSAVALPTPFAGDRIDDAALSCLAARQVEAGTAAIVPAAAPARRQRCRSRNTRASSTSWWRRCSAGCR